MANRPCAPDAEQALLGGVLKDQRWLVKIRPTLNSDSFYYEANQQIYDAMCRLQDKKLPIDLVTLADELGTKLDMVGGKQKLAELIYVVPDAANTEEYAAIVDRFAMLRRIIRAGQDITAIGYQVDQSKEDALGRAMARIAQLRAGVSTRNIEIADMIDDYLAQLEFMQANPGSFIGVGSGLRNLDLIKRGFRAGELIVPAGRPGVGKSSLADGIMLYNAKLGKRVGQFSLEMTAQEKLNRLLCTEAGVSRYELETGMNPAAYQRLLGAKKALSGCSIIINDQRSMTIEKLRALASEMVVTYRLDLLIVDYIQLMQGPQRRNNSRVEDVSEMTRGLKDLARDLNIPIIGLSQLNRQVELRGGDGKPRLSDLRESGSLENDADCVIFIYRPYLSTAKQLQQAKAGKEPCTLIIAKHRNGATGDADVTFQGQYYLFEDA